MIISHFYVPIASIAYGLLRTVSHNTTRWPNADCKVLMTVDAAQLFDFEAQLFSYKGIELVDVPSCH